MTEQAAPARTETGGPNRTPRSEITSIRKPGRKYEPALAVDLSPSMYWSARDEGDRSEDYPHLNSRRAVLEGFLPLFIAALAGEDSEAEEEQADGDDDNGGVMTAGFAANLVDIGDINESNMARKMEAAWDKAGPGTLIAPAVRKLIDKYDAEFEDDDPAVTRVHEIAIITDGEPQDAEALVPYLLAANTKRVYVVGILGHGDAAKAAYDVYKKAAADNQKQDEFGKAHVHVVLFDGVTSPAEIAEDLITLAA